MADKLEDNKLKNFHTDEALLDLITELDKGGDIKTIDLKRKIYTDIARNKLGIQSLATENSSNDVFLKLYNELKSRGSARRDVIREEHPEIGDANITDLVDGEDVLEEIIK